MNMTWNITTHRCCHVPRLWWLERWLTKEVGGRGLVGIGSEASLHTSSSIVGGGLWEGRHEAGTISGRSCKSRIAAITRWRLWISWSKLFESRGQWIRRHDDYCIWSMSVWCHLSFPFEALSSSPSEDYEMRRKDEVKSGEMDWIDWKTAAWRNRITDSFQALFKDNKQ